MQLKLKVRVRDRKERDDAFGVLAVVIVRSAVRIDSLEIGVSRTYH
jgi:hypothetical protein